MTGMPGLPLEGVRVLAVEQMIAAPWATQLLGRLGADVVKVEHPTRGDSGRGSVPRITGPDGRPVGATFLRNNLSKRSVGIDLARGASLVLGLAERCDVFVQNFKAGALDRYGLGYDAVSARNPAVVYASVTGFGTTTPSPYRSWPAYAAVAEAMSGIYEWTRSPGERPVINPVGGLGDIGTGMFAVVGILAALVQRAATGLGQHVDVAMYDSMVAIADVVPALSSLGTAERVPGAILTTFAAADGDVVVQVSREHQFERLASAIGHPEWVDDPRFASRQGWVDHLDDVIRPAVEGWMGGLGRMAACERLAAAGIPCGPCHRPADVLSDPHLVERGMLSQFDRGDGGTYAVPGNPVHLSGSEPAPDRRPPWLGEHTDSVLRDVLGLSASEIESLRSDGVIA